MVVNRANARTHSKWFFQPFQVPDTGILLREMSLPDDYELIRFERNGESRLLSMREMAYHHVAQGTLAREPFMVSF